MCELCYERQVPHVNLASLGCEESKTDEERADGAEQSKWRHQGSEVNPASVVELLRGLCIRIHWVIGNYER